MTQYMTYDMMKDMILHKIGQWVVRPGRTGSPAGADWESAWGGLRTTLLLLMLILGVGQVWGEEPVEITTAEDIANNTKKLYLIQTNAFQSCYIAPQGDNTITTNNILGDYMLWYFLDAGDVNGTQYYYIVSYTENKYICHGGGTSNTDALRAVTLVEKNQDNEERCKFYLVEDNNNGTTGFYNIDAKGKPSYYGLNKRSGSNNYTYPIRLTNDQYIHDSNSKWKFIRFNGTYNWPDPPFTISTDQDKHYYKIHNLQTPAYYISTDATPDKVTYASTESNNMVWYLKAAGSDKWFKYYYIVNPAADSKYMYYSGTVINGNDQTNAVCVKSYNSEDENRYQFVVVQAARGNWDVDKNTDTREECYVIIPKLLKENLWTSNSLGPKTTGEGNMGIISHRNGNYKAQWSFESTLFAEITCDATGTVTITYEDGSDVYYTTNGDIPTETESGTNVKYNPSSKPTISDGITTIKAKAFADGKDPSNVVSKTIVINPTITLTSESYTYDGTAQAPVSSVDVNTTNIAPTEYTVSYKKGEVVVPECKDAGTYTIVLTDAEGGDYIVYGTGNFTIGQKDLTITADSDEKVYDGTALTKNSYTNTALGTGDSFESVTVTGSQTVLGISNNVPSDAVIKNGSAVNVTSNYNITYTNGTLTVTQKPLTITADSESKIYDGTALTKNSYTTNTALADGDVIESVTVSGSQTVSGTSNNVPSGAVIKNTNSDDVTACYDITYTNGTLTVTQKPLTITADSESKIYDGTALTKNSYTTNTALADGDAIESVTVSGSQTVAGIGNNVPSAASIKNGEEDRTASYDITYTYGTLTVTQKSLTITADSDEKEYDGTALTKNSYTNTALADGDSFESVTVTGSQIVAGGSDNVPSAATIRNANSDDVTACYDITYTNGTLTVGQKEVTIGWSNTTLTYSGVEQGPTATVTNKVNNDDVGVTVMGKRTYAGTYNATAEASTLTGDQAGNYKLPNPAPTSDFTINKARLMAVNLENDALTYNGTEQTVTITGVTAGDGTNVTISEVPTEDYDVSGISATNAGTYNVTVTPKSTSTNYETSVSVSKSFTITAKSIGDGGEDPASGFTVDIDPNTNEVTVKQGDTSLTEDADYTVTTDNSNPKYTIVTVSGAGNYGGSVTSTYAKVSFDSNGSAGASWYGTFVADADHAKPAGMTPYIITNITGNTATAVELDYIPSGVPVVLMNSADASGFKVVSGSGTSPAVNLLKEVGASTPGYDSGTEKAHFDVAQIYVLYKGEFVLNKDGNLAKGKVYMEKPSGGLARLKISKGDGTGIENIEYTIDSQSEAWYTLDGRRLSSKPTNKGFYLQSGKKIVVK